MPQAKIQVVDAKNSRFVVVEQTFDDRPEALASDGRKWTKPHPIYALTNINGEFLCAVARGEDGNFKIEATGEPYRAVGT